ncbi:hypothetical protein O3P69_008292 [Scylla paramamosain]|uniref:Uncharacterized protein n=1 Tax=Scylla paramamosain TaxID=85552 RepID=A0AAW0SKL9_SCYPA
MCWAVVCERWWAAGRRRGRWQRPVSGYLVIAGRPGVTGGSTGGSRRVKLFVGMKVERKPQSGMEEVPCHLPSGTEVRQGYHVDPKDQPRALKPYIQPRDSSVLRAHVDLFGGQPLGIFKKREEDTHGPAAPISVLPTWERLYLHELEQSMQHPPSNAFVEMIQWT